MHLDAATVICARWVAPVAPDATLIYENYAVVLDSRGKIADLCAIPEATEKYSDSAIEFVHLPNHLLIPGLVNAHTHTGMTLMRGKADDEPLLTWLHNTVWPIEGKFTHRERFCHDGALLAAAEMLISGTTAFADMYWNPIEAAEAVERAGIRALLGLICIGFPSHFAKSEQEYIENGIRIAETLKDKERITLAWAPHAPYTVSDSALKQLGQLSTDMQIPLHVHLHETEDECSASAKLETTNPACHRSEHAARPLSNFDRLGLVNSRLLAAHVVHTTDEEISLLANSGANVVHCPSSNMKLASGFCRVSDMIAAGVHVALGTDSAASNNSLDMFSEMRAAALLAKNVSRDPTTVPAATALKMATLNGARALGLSDEIGSIELGKQGDLVAVELGTRVHTAPVFHPLSTLVYSATREDVREVWVGGKRLVSNGKLLHLDVAELLVSAEQWMSQMTKEMSSTT